MDTSFAIYMFIFILAGLSVVTSLILWLYSAVTKKNLYKKSLWLFILGICLAIIAFFIFKATFKVT